MFRVRSFLNCILDNLVNYFINTLLYLSSYINIFSGTSENFHAEKITDFLEIFRDKRKSDFKFAICKVTKLDTSKIENLNNDYEEEEELNELFHFKNLFVILNKHKYFI